jgi:hypothetical protein
MSSRSHWLDLAQHLADTWDSFIAGLPLYDPRMDAKHFLHSPHRSPDGGEEVAQLLTQWREHDSLAGRFPLSELNGLV